MSCDHEKVERLIYFSTFEYPSTHAHPLHARLMAEEFSQLFGKNFLFVIGSFSENQHQNIFAVSPFGPLFRLIKLLRIRSIMASLWLFWFLFWNPEWQKHLVIYTNDPVLAAKLGFVKYVFNPCIVVELHSVTKETLSKKLSMVCDRLIFVTKGLRQKFLAIEVEAKEKSMVISNAVSMNNFTDVMPISRKDLGIPPDMYVVAYIGRFKPMTSDKGVFFMIQSLKDLPQNIGMMFVGGTEDELKETLSFAKKQQVSDRTFFVPHTNHKQVPRYMATADALAYVPPQEDFFLAEETSPMKLYEYMAAKKPVIVSNLKTFRAILGDDGAWYINPGSRSDFIEALNDIKRSQERVQKVITENFKKVQNNSWRKRAENVLSGL